MDQPGLLEWCNATRFAMANDPGRPLFKDQIQTHGFLFLDNYLDNILAGPRRDPLIELVKTPGRKKAASKQRTVATTTLKSVISVSLEDEEDAAFKENVAPVNSFHQALLRAKEKPSPPHDQSLAGPASIPVVVAPVRSPSPPAVSENVVAQPQLLVPTPAEQNDLSIIVEDDETDRSRVSLHGGEAVHAEMQTELSRELLESAPAVTPSPARVPSPVAAEVPTNPPSPLQPIPKADDLAPESEAPEPSAPPLPEPTPRHSFEVQGVDYTTPLPEIPPWQPRDMQVDDITEPLPPPTEELTTPSSDAVEMQDVATKVAPISPKGLTRKPSVPSFPSLPAPLPFRKSMRAPPEPSAAQGSATPGAALGGKRTSWLMRAREVKALEITVKKTIPVPPITPGVSNANKRKSDLFGATGLEDEERKSKVPKNAEGDVAPLKPKISDGAKPEAEKRAETHAEHREDLGANEGLLAQLKKTVDGLGSKSLGKSVGGSAVSGLAEAMAAAKARVAERNHKEEEEATMALGTPEAAPNYSVAAVNPASEPAVRSSGSHLRLSVSELVTSSEYNKSKDIDKPVASPAHVGDQSSSTTPPDSPPPVVFRPDPAPVFNKPPPVFVAPAPSTQSSAFKMPVTTAFSKPASMTLGLASRLPSPKQAAPLSAQSTMESVRSEALFDSQDTGPAWMPTTQDTEYTSGFGSQSQCSPPRGMNDADEDDSWPLGERIVPWFDINAKEDSITWSTLPTESQRGDTGPVTQNPSPKNERSFHPIPGSFTMDVDDDEGDEDGDVAFDDGELDEMNIDPLKSTVSLVDPTSGRSDSQMSMASSSSIQSQSQSQAQGGFLSQASKLVSSVLGSSKKSKPEVKSLQLAAVAAKKQQEEKEKKANRLKEMEARRQAALQRKADEEKAKAQDEERKLKEESERRKKEREDNTDKRPLKIVGVKKEDEQNKKRKIVGELDKKQELKKPMLKAPAPAPTTSKLPSKFGKPQPALASSASYNAASSSNLPKSINGKGKLVSKNAVPDDDISQPSQILQSQMAARAKAQLQAANLAPPTIASESIELPDINSEYSDSDDEDRPRTFDPPSWAQSPDLRQALEIQSTINPDDIFGAIRPLRMEELFQNRTGRFRARTSSANWTGTDRLTIEEEREYARRMGFR